jgi:hypothetical protein
VLDGSPYNVAADADSIYFVSLLTQGNALFEVARAGGTPKKLFDFTYANPVWLYPRGGKVYLFSSDCAGPTAFIYDKTTHAVEMHAPGDGVHCGRSSAWMGHASVFVDELYGAYFSDPRDEGSGHTPFATLTHSAALFTGNSHTVFIAVEQQPSSWNFLQVEEADCIAGSSPTLKPLSSTKLSSVRTVVATEDAVFAIANNTEIRRVDVSSGDSSVIATDPHPIEIGVDATHVYWTTSTDVGQGRVRSTPIQGGESKVIATNDQRIPGLWADDLGVLWTTTSPPAIGQLAK